MTIELQRCSACGAHQYPARDVCWRCLSDELPVVEDTGAGRLLATSTVYRSLDEGFAVRLPLRIGTVLLDAGPHLICFVAKEVDRDARVILHNLSEPSSKTLWMARPVSGDGAADKWHDP